MKKKYNEEIQKLFDLVTRNAAILSETTLDVLKDRASEKEKNDILLMRSQFLDIGQKVIENEELDGVEWAKLYIGAQLSALQLEKNINKWSAVLQVYTIDILPKLKKIALEQDAVKREELVDKYYKI